MAILRLEGLGKLKNIYLIGTRSRHLPACSIVPQPTTLTAVYTAAISSNSDLTHFSIFHSIRNCPAWQRRASTYGRALLPYADKHMFLYVLELCKSEAKRTARKWKLYAATQDTALGSVIILNDDAVERFQYRVKTYLRFSAAFA
jgi:hypothetical protein